MSEKTRELIKKRHEQKKKKNVKNKKRFEIIFALTPGSPKSFLTPLCSQFLNNKIKNKKNQIYGSFGWDYPGFHSSFSSKSTRLSIGHSSVVPTAITLTVSECASTTRAMFGTRSSMMSTRSTLTKFLLGRFHFTLCCRFCIESFLHLDQKTFEKY